MSSPSNYKGNSSSLSSSSARLQRLQRTRARSNAAKAAATACSSTHTSETLPPRPSLSRPVTARPSSSSWIKSNDTATPPATPQVATNNNSQSDRSARRIVRITRNIMNNTNNQSETAIPAKGSPLCGESADTPNNSKLKLPSSNAEWFRYTNGTTDTKHLRSSHAKATGPDSPTDKCLISSSSRTKGLKNIQLSGIDSDSESIHPSVKPQHESNEGFQSAKARFEPSTTSHMQTGSQVTCKRPPIHAASRVADNIISDNVHISIQSAISRSETKSTSSVSASGNVLSGVNKSYHSPPDSSSHSEDVKGGSTGMGRSNCQSKLQPSQVGANSNASDSNGIKSSPMLLSTADNYIRRGALKSRQVQTDIIDDSPQQSIFKSKQLSCVNPSDNNAPSLTMNSFKSGASDSTKMSTNSQSQLSTTPNVTPPAKPIALGKFLTMHESKNNSPESISTSDSTVLSPGRPSQNNTRKSIAQSNSSFDMVTLVKRTSSIRNDISTPRKTAPKTHSNNSSGTPVWIHASLLQEPGIARNGWEWVRAYTIQESSTKQSDMTVTLHENGRSHTIPKRDDLILMGNSWWSKYDHERSNQSAPSPTSVAQINNCFSESLANAMPPGDLVELTHLHEPAMVHALKTRYEKDLIYTYTGAILLALNPFKKLDHLYTREIMELYWSEHENRASFIEGLRMNFPDERENVDHRVKEKPPPHVYAVAERAFSCMLHSLEERDQSKSANFDLPPSDQSILVSGESGAGKTVTTKIIMRYLTILSQRRMNVGSGKGMGGSGLSTDRSSVETQVLQSNPVLESFGNARTIRNDNSSRFGKFIQMSFSSSNSTRGTLLGASIHFYLLEKVRLVSVNQGERNYHVFYEVLSPAMDVNEKKRYMLTSNFGRGSNPSTARDFYMTSVSGTFDRRDGVNDSDTYQELRMAMDTVGFSFDEQDGIFSVVAALLHASNLRFMLERGLDSGSEDCVVYKKDGTLAAVAKLLGVSDEAVESALTTTTIEARGERLIKKLSMEQAGKALDALSKAVYGALFAFIVNRINESIEVNRCNGGQEQVKTVATIGVLDIFGFESFDKNSFEQLCINYCNEVLQQQFNRFVFKAEQAEYEYEGIEWSNIEFADNQVALDLIDDRRTGIFSILDEQCRLPKCTDITFVRAIYDKCEKNAYFSGSQMQKSKGTFVISHYAGQVEYDSDGFLLKNKDDLPKSAGELLASSSRQLISKLSTIVGLSSDSSGDRAIATLKRSSSSFTQSSVSGQFASQLRDLRSRISLTGPHYIRCLKPNDTLLADQFDEYLIAHQLNCAGVLPAMKLARAGYSMRYSHSSFILRFQVVASRELPPKKKSGHSHLTCHRLISLLSERLETQMKRMDPSRYEGITNVVSWGVQIGKTRVFLRVAAFEALEELRISTINAAATRLQSWARAFLCRSSFFLILGSVITLQCAARKLIASLCVQRLRCTSRAIIIQKHWRSYSMWSSFQNILFLTVCCQRYWRGGKVRKNFVSIKQYRAAITLQSFWRSRARCVIHRRIRDAVIVVQSSFRIWSAKKVTREIRRQARDLHLIAQERDQLRLEMKQMRRELEEIKRNHCGISGSSICVSHGSLSNTSEPSVRSPTQEIKLLFEECAKKDRELQQLREQIESLRGNGSVSSTLPTTVTFDSNFQSDKSRIESIPHSTAAHRDQVAHATQSTQSNLLDSELEGLEDLERSLISGNEHSFETPCENNKFPTIQLSSESQAHDSAKAYDFPIHRAIQCNNKAMFLDEIGTSADIDLDINSVDTTGRTPLHIAVQCANIDFIQLILSHNVVVNSQDFSGNTALHYAQSIGIAEILLNHGVNPNIPNCDGLCALHLAVKGRNFALVRCLLSNGADVTYADDVCWYTPLHLIAHAEALPAKSSLSVKGPIAELLCEATHPSAPDLNYQDRDGNTPLHHAASLAEEDAGILISIFIEHGACPKIANNRGQTPVHLYCHNNSVRQYVFYHEALQLMLAKGANPNQQSLSGCTPLHLALFHRDLKSAALLVRYGAELNAKWKKPLKWDAFWTDMDSEVVMPLDMVKDVKDLHVIISEISTPQSPASHRGKCMHCKTKFRLFSRQHNCSHCGRSICGRCSGSLKASFLPFFKRNVNTSSDEEALLKVCVLCEAMLLSRGDDRVFSTIMNDENSSELSIGTLSM